MLDLEAIKSRLAKVPVELEVGHDGDDVPCSVGISYINDEDSKEYIHPIIVLNEDTDDVGYDESGCLYFFANAPTDIAALITEIERLQAAVTAEREACAKVAETVPLASGTSIEILLGKVIAESIRNRTAADSVSAGKE